MSKEHLDTRVYDTVLVITHSFTLIRCQRLSKHTRKPKKC